MENARLPPNNRQDIMFYNCKFLNGIKLNMELVSKQLDFVQNKRIGEFNMFEKLNMRNTVASGIDTSEMDYVPLKNFCGKEFIIDGYFFTKGMYGKQVVLVNADENVLVNMPARSVEQFQKIDKDEEMLKAVLSRKCKVINIRMKETSSGTTTIYDLADC